MYVSIRHYQTTVPGLNSDLINRLRTEFAPILRSIPGFHAYRVVDTGSNEIATISFFETAEGAQASIEKSADWVHSNLADLIVGQPTVILGEQVFSELV